MSKWYVIRVVSGKENKTKEAIEYQLKESNNEHVVNSLLIPSQKTIQIKRGKKVTVDKNLIPGYIFVECESIDEVESNIKHVNGVTNILKQQLSESEVKRLLGTEDEKDKIDYDVVKLDQKVKIIDGPFDSFVGTVKEVENNKQKLKVAVLIFGRETLIDLNMSQVVNFY